MAAAPRRRPDRKRLSPLANALGVIGLSVVLVIIDWGVLGYSGLGPESVTGMSVGTFLGLGTLAVELAVIRHAYRTQVGDPAQATFGTFFMRLAVVGLLHFAFMAQGSGVDPSAFSLSYCGSFFVYMCWLTWRIATLPPQYQGGAGAAQPVERRAAACGRDA